MVSNADLEFEIQIISTLYFVTISFGIIGFLSFSYSF